MTGNNKNSGLKYGICALGTAVLLFCGCGAGGSEKPAEQQEASGAQSLSEYNSGADTAEGAGETVGSPEESETVGSSEQGDDKIPAEEGEGSDTPVYTLGEDEIGMVLLNGLLYMDSGETVQTPPSGEQITILTSVGSDEIPGRDRESNFGTGFQAAVSADGKAYVLIGEEWHVFRRPGAVDAEEELKPPAITLVDPANDMLNGVTLEASSYTIHASDEADEPAGSETEASSYTIHASDDADEPAGSETDDGMEDPGIASLEGMQPLDEEVLQLKPLRVRGVKVPYTFGCNVQPDEITVSVYSFNDVGREDDPPAVSEETYFPPYYVELDKGWIYTIRAGWSIGNASENGFYGEAEYIFTTY